MSQDIEFINASNNGVFDVSIPENPNAVSGNRLMANIFEVTFLTDLNNSLLSNGYGGNGTAYLSLAYDPNDIKSISAMLQIAIDNTVETMRVDQDSFGQQLPQDERISSASLVEVTKIDDVVSVNINLVPELYEIQYIQQGIIVSLPL